MNAHLKLEFLAGEDINHACREAIRIANTLCVTVDFDFNGVKVMAKPGACPQELADEWSSVLKSSLQSQWSPYMRAGEKEAAAMKAAATALSAAKDGGWLPIEKASDSDKRRCWVLVGESVYFASYIVIGFEEKRDLDGCYIGQVDHDEYWMDIDSGDTLEPTHFQPLARPLPTPPKDPA